MLIAFHGDEAIKAKYLNRIHAHAAADEIVHGYYWENGVDNQFEFNLVRK